MTRWNFKEVVKLWGPVVFWMGLIFIGSSLPSASVSQNPLVDFLVHKLIHLFEYGFLAVLLYRASHSLKVAIVFALAFGASDEWHQTFIPGREGRVRDLLVDTAGVFLGLGVLFKRRKRLAGRPLVVTKSAEETRNFALNLAKKLKGGEVLALYGDLGSGKTTFVQGLARGLGIKRRVTSASFVLVKEYKVETEGTVEKLIHIDLYRLHSEEEIANLGLQEKFLEPQALVVIEWADRLGKALPQGAKSIFFDYFGNNCRRLRFKI